MPTKPLDAGLAREARELVDSLGGPSVHGVWAEAETASGINRSTIKHRYYRYEDPAVADAKAAIGTGMKPALVWAKTKSEDGTSYSVLLKPDAVPDDLLDRVRNAFEGLAPAAAVPPPRYAEADLLTVYPIADAHIGMMAWGRESGADYDTSIACARLKEWIGRCVAASPASEEAVIVDVGDMIHVDNSTNATPKSKHTLDVDTRFFRTAELTIAAMASCVDLALQKHKTVRVVVLPGNHDPHAYLILLFALAERYREEPRVHVIKEPGEFWVHRFGANLVAFHHGDKARAERLVLWLADEHPELWGKTKYRHLWTGHLHHHKSADIGGVMWEQLRAMTEKDAYARSHAYSARAQLQGITLHKERGEISRVKVSA